MNEIRRQTNYLSLEAKPIKLGGKMKYIPLSIALMQNVFFFARSSVSCNSALVPVAIVTNSTNDLLHPLRCVFLKSISIRVVLLSSIVDLLLNSDMFA